ncbi:hypothetical protein BTDUT50_02910 [Neobacillus thermocopriae]|nr:hypothetical protein BTDUT50_02910 [Neobacillus thermocopriae]
MRYNFEINMNANNAHTAILRKIKNNSKVLEFGPATGYMTKYMKENLNCTVYGVEIDERAAAEAIKYSEDVVVCDIDTLEWKNKLNSKRFDYIIFADVLEHLKNPWKVLRESKDLLDENGIILISIPNISHNAVIMELLSGEFRYRKLGLLDDTHLRFFTRNTLLELVNDSGLTVTNLEEVVMSPEITELKKHYSDFPESISSYLKSRIDGHVYQYIVTAQKSQNVNGLKIKEDVPSIRTNKKLYIVSDYVQLFWDTGRGYNEDESIKLPIINKESLEEYIFELPDASIKSLRLDPGNSVGFGIIKDIYLVNDYLDNRQLFLEELVPLHGVDFLNKTKEGYHFISHNTDPQLEIKFNSAVDLRGAKIKIILSYTKEYRDSHIFYIKNEMEKCIKSELLSIKMLTQELKENNKILLTKLTERDEKIQKLEENNNILYEKLVEKEAMIETLISNIKILEKQYIDLTNTLSWKITKPFRALQKIIKNRIR